MVKKKVVIHKLAFPIDGVYWFDVKLLTSIDGGLNYYYCGYGRFCKTEQEAEEYADRLRAEYDCVEVHNEK